MMIFNISISCDLADASGMPVGDLALDLLARAPYVRYRFLGDQQPSDHDPSCQERLYSLQTTADHVARSNGIVVCRPWIKASAFSRGSEDLVAIGRAGIGYDKIDLEACTAADVVVFNSPFGLTHATASAALLLILALARHLPLQERIVREHRWDRQLEAVGDDLTGQTLGIVGLGQTGGELARLVAPFQMRVIAYSPHADPAVAARLGVELVGRLEEVFRQADFLSLHTRLTETTRGMVGESLLGLLKPTAYFINVARGEIVDQRALVRCLRERRIAGAGLDVFEHEPLPPADPLLALDNVILTPHWLCSTRQGGRATMVGVMEGMLQVARGNVPEHVVNPGVLEPVGFRAKLRRYVENQESEASPRR